MSVYTADHCGFGLLSNAETEEMEATIAGEVTDFNATDAWHLTEMLVAEADEAEAEMYRDFWEAEIRGLTFARY